MTKANLLSNHLQKTKHTASAVSVAVVCLVCVFWVPVMGRAGLCLGLLLRAGLVRGFLVTIEVGLGCSRLGLLELVARAGVAAG